MRVTVCQIDPRSGQLPKSLAALGSHLNDSESDLLLLPEMAFSEWLAGDNTPSAERWDESVETNDSYIVELGDLGVAHVVGTRPIVNTSQSRRNEAYVWTEATNYASPVREKYYLPDEDGYWEHSWYDRGAKSFDTARAGDALVGIQICTEMWFFEWSRHYASERVDLLCIPRATPHDTTDKWIAGGQAAAVCSGAYSLSSNLWYPRGVEANCGGVGWIIDPEGRVLATTSEEQPFVTAEIDLNFSRLSKSTYPRYIPE